MYLFGAGTQDQAGEVSDLEFLHRSARRVRRSERGGQSRPW